MRSREVADIAIPGIADNSQTLLRVLLPPAVHIHPEEGTL